MAATLEVNYFNSFWLKKIKSITDIETVTLPANASAANIINLQSPSIKVGAGQVVTNVTNPFSGTVTVVSVAANNQDITISSSETVTLNDQIKFTGVAPNANIPQDYDSDAATDWYIEEARIRGGYNNTSLDYGVKAFLVEDTFAQQHRISSLIYSGIFNSRTGVNDTNQFSVGLDITKSADPANGSIQKLYAEDTNLIIFQEDKVSRALIDKDAIYSAEGNAMVTSRPLVIGQIIAYAGEYGISTDPNSFAVYSYRKYFTDRKRGCVLRLSHDGITEISSYGMHDFFRDTLNLASNIVGAWDNHNKNYIISIQETPSNLVTKDIYPILSSSSPVVATAQAASSAGPNTTILYKNENPVDGIMSGQYASGTGIPVGTRVVNHTTVGLTFDQSVNVLNNTVISFSGVGYNAGNNVTVILATSGSLTSGMEIFDANTGEFYGITKSSSYDYEVTSKVELVNNINGGYFTFAGDLTTVITAGLKSLNTTTGVSRGLVTTTVYPTYNGSSTRVNTDQFMWGVDAGDVISFSSIAVDCELVNSIPAGASVSFELRPYSTVSFDESVLGWTSFYKYRPSYITSIKSDFYSFFYGNIYHHNALNTYGNYYGLIYPSTVTLILNSNPSVIKNFKTINYEGSQGWALENMTSSSGDVTLPITEYVFKTDLTALENQIWQNTFKKKEDKYFANLINNSTATQGEVVFGPDMSGVKGFFSTVKMTLDNRVYNNVKKELFAISSTIVESSY